MYLISCQVKRRQRKRRKRSKQPKLMIRKLAQMLERLSILWLETLIEYVHQSAVCLHCLFKGRLRFRKPFPPSISSTEVNLSTMQLNVTVLIASRSSFWNIHCRYILISVGYLPFFLKPPFLTILSSGYLAWAHFRASSFCWSDGLWIVSSRVEVSGSRKEF